MRKTLVAGVVLAVAATLVVLISAALDLGLESVALLGAALGAVVALVPDRSALERVLGFVAGFVIGFLGYVLRVASLPDTAGGRAVAVAIVVLLCVAVAAGSLGRVPLWSVLLGAASVAGAYEFTYTEAPSQLPTTAVSTATTLLFNVAVGFAAASVFAPVGGRGGHAAGHTAAPATGGDDHDDHDDSASLDDMMEKTK
jgi:hypothetical protein